MAIDWHMMPEIGDRTHRQPTGTVKVDAGNLRNFSYSERADSLFCESCGSTVAVDFKPELHMYYIALGTVDGDPDCPDGFHRFVGSKAPWYDISDDLPQHDEWPVEPT